MPQLVELPVSFESESDHRLHRPTRCVVSLIRVFGTLEGLRVRSLLRQQCLTKRLKVEHFT